MTCLVTVLILAGCGSNETTQPVPSTTSLKLLALGDSYTIGQGVVQSQSWPFQLAAALRTDSHSVAQPTIVAETGWTTSDLLQAIAETNLDPPYDIVTLLIGVNDQFQGFDQENYTPGFVALLERAISFAESDTGRVIIISIPDYTVTPFGQANSPAGSTEALNGFNTVNRETATNRGVYYVDITPISRQALDDPELIASDDLHPSGKMYAQWVQELLPVVRLILQRLP
jgi:acyl-CoA thioesterase-1